MRRFKKAVLAIESLEDRCLLSACDNFQGLVSPIQTGHITSPVVLQGSSTTPSCYYLTGTNDTLTADGTALVVGNQNVTVDLNGKNISYGNQSLVDVLNGDFEEPLNMDGTIPHWGVTTMESPPQYALQQITPDFTHQYGTHAMHDGHYLQLQGIRKPYTLVSDNITLPTFSLPPNVTAYSFAATATVRSFTAYGDGGHDATVNIGVYDVNDPNTDLTTEPMLSTTKNCLEGYFPVSKFNATPSYVGHQGQTIFVKITVTPATNSSGDVIPTTIDLDWVTVRSSYDYGILAARSAARDLPIQLQQLAGDTYGSQANETIVNSAAGTMNPGGQIVQGSAYGYGGNPISLRNVVTGFYVSGVTAVVDGMDMQNLDADYTVNGTVDSSTFSGAQERIRNRQKIFPAISLRNVEGSVNVTNNFIYGTSHVGIAYQWDQNGTPSVKIDNNIIQENAYIADCYGISISSAMNFEVSNNRINPAEIPGFQGRGIILDAVYPQDSQKPTPVNQYGTVHGNYVNVYEGPDLEYGNILHATAFRLRDSGRFGPTVTADVAIYDNSFTASTDTNGDYYAVGGYINKNRTIPGGGPIVFRNNMFHAYVQSTNAGATDWNSSQFNAMGITLSNSETGVGLKFVSNVIESDDASLVFGNSDDIPGTHLWDTYFMSNTLLWDSNPNIVNFQTAQDRNLRYVGIIAGDYQTDVEYNRILNTLLPQGPTVVDTNAYPPRHGRPRLNFQNNTVTWQTAPEVDGVENLVVFGISTDNQVYFEAQVGGNWSPWTLTQLSPNGVNGFTAIARMMDSQGLPLLAAIGTDGQVYSLSSYWDSQLGLQWNNWTLTTSTSNGAVLGIAAVTDNNGNQNIYAIQSDHNVYSETLVNGQWGPWHRTQPLYMQAISATTDATGVAEIYGLDQNNYVETQRYLGTAWSSWSLTSTTQTVRTVSAVTDATGTVWVFGTVVGSDNVYYEYSNGSGWVDWQLTVATTNHWYGISAGLDVNGNLVVFGRRDDGQIYEETESGGVWSWAATSSWAAGFIAVA